MYKKKFELRDSLFRLLFYLFPSNYFYCTQIAQYGNNVGFNFYLKASFGLEKVDDGVQSQGHTIFQ